MFRPNKEQQTSLFDRSAFLTDAERGLLESSWAGSFAADVFDRIDEGPFRVLYSERASRPNVPVNVLVGALILKELGGLTDEELVGNLTWDLRYQHALRATSASRPLSLRTLSRFRVRLYRHQLETGEDLLKGCVRALAEHACDEMEIDGSVRRMDSMMVESSARTLSRDELIYECVANVCRHLARVRPGLLPEGLARYADRDDLNRTFYHDGKTSREDRERRILADADALVALLGGDALAGDGDGEARLALLVRALGEQTIVDEAPAAADAAGGDAGVADGADTTREDPEGTGVGEGTGDGVARRASSEDDGRDGPGGDGTTDSTCGARPGKGEEPDEEGDGDGTRRRLRTREDGMPAGSGMLQSPHDPDATFRRKAGKDHRGFAANFEESCGRNGTVVTNYQYGPNNTSDAEFLRQSIEDAEPVEGGAMLVTDGGYDGEDNIALAADKGIELVTTSLTGKDPADCLADFEWSADGRSLVRCAAGHEPTSCGFYESSGQVRASFPAGTCSACPHREQCRARCGRRVDSVTASPRSTRRAAHLRRMATEEFKAISRLRNGAETVPSVMRRRYRIDEAPAGTIMGGIYVSCKVAALNFRKLEDFRHGRGHCHENPLLGERAA